MIMEYLIEYMADCKDLKLCKTEVLNRIINKYDFSKNELELLWEIA
jgi:predicted house-cleaning noncanonical NTP pyrophosphatase (MazG superfamily)